MLKDLWGHWYCCHKLCRVFITNNDFEAQGKSRDLKFYSRVPSRTGSKEWILSHSCMLHVPWDHEQVHS